MYSRYVGNILGSAIAAEGLFPFGLESAFLGVIIFGWNRVSSRIHFISIIGVFIGSMFSIVWIVGEGLNTRAEVTYFWLMIFNPSSVDFIMQV